MVISGMRWLGAIGVLVGAVVGTLGCGSPPPPKPPEPMLDPPREPGTFAEEDRFIPAYGKPELGRAMTVERDALAAADRAIAELETREADTETLRKARADFAVRKRFMAALESCETAERHCPPRLDEPKLVLDVEAGQPPKLEAALRFDRDGWRKIADELHARACACRTIACIDAMFVAMNQLETRPMPDVLSDEAATLAITRGRQCLYRLRGAHR